MKAEEFKSLLLGIVTEQFADFPDKFILGEMVSPNLAMSFGYVLERRVVALSVSITQSQKEIPYLKLQIALHFQLDENTWKEVYNEQSKTITIPKDNAIHLASLAIGTARGALHAKTEGKPYNSLIIPLMNVFEFIKEDIIMQII